MRLHGIHTVSIYEPGGQSVTLRRLVGDAVTFRTGPLEDSEERTPTGEPYYGGDDSFFEARALDWEHHPRLAQWLRDKKRLKMRAVGPTQMVMWDDPAQVYVEADAVRGAMGGRRGYLVRMVRQGHGRHNIRELASAFGDGPIEDAGSGVAEGWQTYGEAAASWNDGQRLSAAAGKVGGIQRTIEFPVPGVVLELSVEASGESGKARLRVEQFDAEDALLADEAGAPGALSLVVRLVDDVHHLRVRLEVEGGTVTVEEITLRPVPTAGTG